MSNRSPASPPKASPDLHSVGRQPAEDQRVVGPSIKPDYALAKGVIARLNA